MLNIIFLYEKLHHKLFKIASHGIKTYESTRRNEQVDGMNKEAIWNSSCLETITKHVPRTIKQFTPCDLNTIIATMNLQRSKSFSTICCEPAAHFVHDLFLYARCAAIPGIHPWFALISPNIKSSRYHL